MIPKCGVYAHEVELQSPPLRGFGVATQHFTPFGFRCCGLSFVVAFLGKITKTNSAFWWVSLFANF
jgi:hypothetical protein